MDVFLHLKDSDSRIDFVVQKCSALPDLSEEGFEQEGQGWRGGGGNDGGSGYGGGGGYKGGHQRNQSYGNGSNFNKGGDRGSGGGGGFYNRQNSDNGGWNSKGKDWRQENAGSNWDNSHSTNDWKGNNDQEDWSNKIKNKYGVPTSGTSSKSSFAYSTPGSTVSTPNPYDGQSRYPRGGNNNQQSNLDSTVYVKNLSYETGESHLTDFFRQNKLRV